MHIYAKVAKAATSVNSVNGVNGVNGVNSTDSAKAETMATLQEIAVKIISDDAFAQALLANPEETLQSEGITPTQEMLEAIRGIDIEELRSLTAAFTDENKAM